MFQRRMVGRSVSAPPSHISIHQLIFSQLSKEDEAAGRGDETEVRREDQEKINRFSRLHQRETVFEEQLKSKQVRQNPEGGGRKIYT